MNYNEALDWIDSFSKFGIKLGLERIKHICEKLNNPQNNYDIIHVGGSNGKGSVCTFLASILEVEGYSVGIYTSPHLQRFSERIIVDDEEIKDHELIELVEKIKPIVEDMAKNDNTPTYFEIVTAISFEHFRRKHVEYAIIEVGLGGRFDATNIVSPLLSIITNVSLEHQDKLGNSIEEIAFEKAGIIKEKIPVLTAAKKNALEVIKKVTDEKKSDLTIVNDNLWEKISGGIDWQEFNIYGDIKDYNAKIFLPGEFLGENVALAIKAVEVLQMNGVFVSDESISAGFEKTMHPGRMEIIDFEPLILLDGAHNIAGINKLIETIQQDFAYSRMILVLGVLRDKKIQEILDLIVPLADVVIFTKSKNPRSYQPDKLKKLVDENVEVEVKKRISFAVDYAKSIAGKNDFICITGSLFTVGEARDYLFK